MTPVSPRTLEILGRPGPDWVNPEPTIAVDVSSRDELARSISGMLMDCPHMSQDKIADYIAAQIWHEMGQYTGRMGG